jgi:hypothetical protein
MSEFPRTRSTHNDLPKAPQVIRPPRRSRSTPVIILPSIASSTSKPHRSNESMANGTDFRMLRCTRHVRVGTRLCKNADIEAVWRDRSVL